MRKLVIFAILCTSLVFQNSVSHSSEIQNDTNPTPAPSPSSTNEFSIKPNIINPRGPANDFGSGGQAHMVGIVNSQIFLEERELDLNIFQNQFCAGTLVTNTWVLTAAHCVDNNETYSTTDPDNIQVFSSYEEIDLDNLDYTDAISIDSITIHPEYDRLDSGTLINDLALLKLSSPMPIDTPVFDFGLPTNPGDALEIYGWGVSGYSTAPFNINDPETTDVVPSLLYLDVNNSFTWRPGTVDDYSTYASDSNILLSEIDPLFRVETSTIRSYINESLDIDGNPVYRARQTYAPIRYDFSLTQSCESIGQTTLITDAEYYDGEEWIEIPDSDFGFLTFFTARIKSGSNYSYSFYDWLPVELSTMPNNSCGYRVEDLNKSIDNFITDNLSLNGVQPIEEQFESAMLMADVNSVNCDAQELDQQLIGKVICIDKTDINNADTCQGDSGGPLYKKIRNELYLVGVTSFGSFPCDDGDQSVFTDLSKYSKWIRSYLPLPGTLSVGNSVTRILADQTPVTLSSTSSPLYNGEKVIFITDSPNCSTGGNIAYSELVITQSGTCNVLVKFGAKGAFPSKTSASKTFTFLAVPQAALSISNSPKTNLPAGTSVTLTPSGGSGSGAVTYRTSSSGCSITSGVLNVTSPRSCAVTATKSANGIYSSTTATATFTFVAVPQAALRITNTNRNNLGNNIPVRINVAGGNGSGSISFSVTGPGCYIVEGNKVVSNHFNNSRCLVSAFKGPSGIYGIVRSTPPTSFNFLAPTI
jgi:secreted trypsin-like serine protease